MTIKVRLNDDGTFRVVSWTPFLYILSWKHIEYLKTAEETKKYIRELTKNNKSKLDIKPDAFRLLYQD